MKNDFLPIPDAPGYEVNSQLLVRNIKTGRILKPYVRKGETRTPKVHIPKYHIRRTPKSLRNQAVIAKKENGKDTKFELIPNFNGTYEINPRGIVRNAKTKHRIKIYTENNSKYVVLSKDYKSFTRTIDSLLWEVHGIIKSKQHPRICPVAIRKDNECRFFEFQKDCIDFLCKREFYCRDYVRKKLSARVENFRGWITSCKESF